MTLSDAMATLSPSIAGSPRHKHKGRTHAIKVAYAIYETLINWTSHNYVVRNVSHCLFQLCNLWGVPCIVATGSVEMPPLRRLGWEACPGEAYLIINTKTPKPPSKNTPLSLSLSHQVF